MYLICHHAWDYMACIICVANAYILPKLLCLGHLKTYQTRNIKNKRFKTTNMDCKNLPNKAVDTVQLYQLNVSSIWHTVQLAFYYLSYESLF